MEITGEAREVTPKHEWAAALARALMGARRGLNFALNWPGGGLGDLLIGKAPEGWEKVSYGDYPYGFAESGLGDRLPRLRRGRAEEVVDMASTLPIGAVAKGGAPAIAGVIRLKGDILTPYVAEKITQKLTPDLEKAVDPAFADKFRTSLARFLTTKAGEKHPLVEGPAWIDNPFDSKKHIHGTPDFDFIASRRLIPAEIGTWEEVFDVILSPHLSRGHGGSWRWNPQQAEILSKSTGLTPENFIKVAATLPRENIIAKYNEAFHPHSITQRLFEALAHRLSERQLRHTDFLSMLAEDKKIRGEMIKAYKVRPTTTALKFPDDWEWKELGPRDLKKEGDIMQHCVGSSQYVEACLAGIRRIFSLRGPEGQPRLTVDARQQPDGTFEVRQIRGYKNTKANTDFFPRLQELLKAYPELDVSNSMDYADFRNRYNSEFFYNYLKK